MSRRRPRSAGWRFGDALVGSLRGRGSGTCAWFGHGTGEARLCSLVSKDRSDKPMVKSSGARRESDGVVVPKIAVSNAVGGKGPDFGHARGEGKRRGMTGTVRSNDLGGQSRPVDAGAGLVSSVGKVRERQRKLWAVAKQSEGRRFHALYDRIYRGDVLVEVWERVRANRGAAGVDRVSLVAVEEYGQEAGSQPTRRTGGALDRILVPRPGTAQAARHHPLPEGCVTMSRRPSVSRMRENRTYGLKGGWGNRAAQRHRRP